MPLRYKPLNAVVDEIRLLRRRPSKDNMLHFSLESFPLSSAPPFWAFSYVWGDPNKTSRIVVNNFNFEATENLVAALTTHVNEILSLDNDLPDHPHFRAKHLWVDAVCINQQDLEERNQQVSRMHDIYRQGIVCIYVNKRDRDAYKSVQSTLDQLSADSDADATSGIPGTKWRELVEFFTKDWFHRMWMIQEFVLASSFPLFLFLGGHKGIESRRLRDAAWQIIQISPADLTAEEEIRLLSGVKQYMCLAEVKDLIKEGHECSFTTLLWTFRDRRASDPRDKIYSLLGLLQLDASDQEAERDSNLLVSRGLAYKELLIDYQASVEDVYASLVRSVILGSGSLNVLCACQRPRGFRRSWIPDWTESWSRHSLLTSTFGLVPDYLRKERFRSSADSTPVFGFTEGLRSIKVHGTRHSTVSVLGARPQACTDSKWIMDWFNDVEHNLKAQISEQYGEELDDAQKAFVLAACAIHDEDIAFTLSEAFADEYCLPYNGASLEWKQMVQSYRNDTLSDISSEQFTIDIRIAQILDGRKVFIGDNGYCGLIPDHTQQGDLICVLFGCDVPVVLRPGTSGYTFIGESYVRWLMYGEAIEALERGDVVEERFEIF